jgi:uncharacterized protein (TIGR00730 family)
MDDKPERQPQTRERAYRNVEFLESRDARALRILSEYLEPASRFRHHRVDDTIVFMGSARLQSRADAEAALAEVRRTGGDVALAERKLDLSAYYEAARELAGRLTEWSKGLGQGERRFLVCTGGGPGIMEAANRGASEARGLNIGLGITLPHEQALNPYISRELAFNFHYFFMRKFWFAYQAKAVVFFPGGFGTLDELFELLTLLQTGKIRKRMPIVLFGDTYWNQVLNLEAMVAHGTIDARDLELLFRTDSVNDAFDYLVKELTEYALPNPGAKL